MYTLLIAEDETLIRTSLATTIDWASHDIRLLGAAADGAEAYAMSEEHSPDILLTDIRMPVLDGLDLIARLRGTDWDGEAILLSGYHEFAFAQQGLRLGALDYLLKPCRPEDLLSAVTAAMKKLQVKRPQQQVATLPTPSSTFPSPSAARDKPLHRTVAAALDIIRNHYHSNLTLDAVAREVFVSTAYLCTLFKQELGSTFLECLHHHRIERAKELLDEHQLKIYAVAKLVGYQDERHFSTTFKKWTGQSPSHYRNRPQN